MGNSESTIHREVSKITVKQFNLQAYSGVWYTIAGIPLKSTAKCEYTVSTCFATSETTMNITNYCMMVNDLVSLSNGRLRVVDTTDPGKLELIFDDEPEQKYEYWIYDTDYRGYAIVGGGNDTLVWILARVRNVPGASLSALVNRVGALGYDKSRIVIKGDALRD